MATTLPTSSEHASAETTTPDIAELTRQAFMTAARTYIDNGIQNAENFANGQHMAEKSVPSVRQASIAEAAQKGIRPNTAVSPEMIRYTEDIARVLASVRAKEMSQGDFDLAA